MAYIRAGQLERCQRREDSAEGSAQRGGHQHGQPTNGTVLQRLHCPLVTAHDGGRLSDGQPLQKPQHDALALVVTEAAHTVDQLGDHAGGNNIALWVLGAVGVEDLRGAELQAVPTRLTWSSTMLRAMVTNQAPTSLPW